MELEQTKADEYMATKKKFLKPRKINLTQPFDLTETLFSDVHGDIFKLDFRQGKIELKAGSLNHRAHDCFVLCRLCIDKHKIHKNPDGKKVIGHHVHVYKEGFGDKIVYPASEMGFDDPENFLKSLNRFFTLCNIDGSKFEIQERLTK